MDTLGTITHKVQEKVLRNEYTLEEQENINKIVTSTEYLVRAITAKVPNHVSILQELVNDLNELKLKNHFDFAFLKALSTKFSLIAYQVERQEANVLVVDASINTIYDNGLLNHYELFKEACEIFGIDKTLNLGSLLSTKLIEEALMEQDTNIILAGLLSLDFLESI